MGVAGAIIGGAGISAVGGILAGERAASAASRAARSQIEAQQLARREDIALRRESRNLAMELAEASPEELAAIERATELNEQDIANKTRLLESVDPALMESGKQALQLLQGEEARTLDPIRRQRAELKEELRNRLVSQFGPGFENSSAGIRAINDFDAETDSLLAIEQDRSLGRLLGASQNIRQFSSITPNIGLAGTIADLRGGLQRRQVAAVQGTPLSSPFTVEGTSAGFAGEAIRAKSQGSALGQIGGAVSLAGILGPLLPKNQTTTPGATGGLGGGGGSPFLPTLPTG